MPNVTEENKVIKDITHWRDYVHAPDIIANCSDDVAWEAVRCKAREAAGDSKLVAGFIPTGIFEQCHNLMPFQEVLTNLYDHPEDFWQSHMPYNCCVNIIEAHGGKGKVIAFDKVYYSQEDIVDHYSE